jgi:hypothetical protein
MALYGQDGTNAGYNNVDLNAIGSQYAAQGGHDTNSLIQKITKSLIFDAAPQQFFDLKLLSAKPFESVNSDEWFFHEMGFGREPIVVTSAIAGGTASEVVSVSSTGDVSVDTMLVLPNNQKVIVSSVDEAAGQITVRGLEGAVLPAVAANQVLSNLSPVEADGATSISQYFRIDTIERYNYVQMLVKAMRFGRMELHKYEKANTTSNYLSMQKQRMIQQFRIDLSNILWNGERGEVTLADGKKAKTTGGIFPTMQAAGSPNITTTVANLDDALEELALDTEFKAFGTTRFLYGTPRRIHQLSQQYKRELTRYAPNDDMAKLGLMGVDMGSSKIVFVPMKRFEELSCFPASWADRLILLDQEAVSCVQVWGEEMGESSDRREGHNLNTYKDFWMSTTMGVQFNNPLGSGWIDII